MNSFSSLSVPVGNAKGFKFLGNVDCWVYLSETNTVIPSLDAVGTICAGGYTYEFDIMPGFDKFIHVAGNGVTGNCYITLVG